VAGVAEELKFAVWQAVSKVDRIAARYHPVGFAIDYQDGLVNA
jgi:hypothetical protein